MRFLLLVLGLFIAALTLSFCTHPVHAEVPFLTIATGKPGGGYDGRAHQIAERLLQRGVVTAIENKNGSDEIGLALCSGHAGVGILQIDAIYARSQEGCALKSVAVYGNEVAVILFPPNSPYDELSDLSATDAVMVDTIGSGTDLFWRTIVKLEGSDKGSKDAWAQARAVNDPLDLAAASAAMGDVAAVILVRKAESADIQRLLDQGWLPGELWDADIDGLLFNGSPLYGSAKRDLGSVANRRPRAWAYDMRSFVAVAQAVATGDRKLFAAIASASQ